MAVVCMSACGEADLSPRQPVRVDTVGGTVFVESAPRPPAAPRLRTRIGASDVLASGPTVFGRISSVTMSRDGSIYVADAQANEVRVFSLDGDHVRTFGRPGQGPGEFGDLYSLGWLGDTLAALDPGNARISLHSADGSYLGQRRWLAYSGPTSVIRLFSRPPGDLYAPYPSFDRENPRHVFLRFRPGILDPDTVGHPQAQRGPAGSLCSLPDGGVSFFSNPFAPKEVVVPGMDGAMVSAGTSDGRVVFWDEPGDSIGVWGVGERPRPLPDVRWDSVTAEFTAYLSDHPGADCDPERLARPAALPRLSDVFFTTGGLLVVERPSATGTRFDVFDRAGALAQRVDLPARDPGVAPTFLDRWVLVVERDALDVQSVALYER